MCDCTIKCFFVVCLSNDSVELKHSEVDINPQYLDSLDVEIFKLHLTFERLGGEALQSNLTLSPFAKSGLDAFQRGLNEVNVV